MTYHKFKKQFSIHLDAQQEAAVQAIEGQVLLLAVPGSGKTTVLVTRLGYLLFCGGVPPQDILTMTYTVAATGDMARRFASLFGEDLARRMAFRTIHAVAVGVIRTYERTRKRTAFSLVHDEGEIARLIGEIYRRVTGQFPVESEVKAIRTKITYVKNQMLGAEEIEALAEEGIPFGPIYRTYCQRLREQGRMDFDDQMVYAVQILQRCPEVLARYQARYRYLCVDEAQDTSKLQHYMIRLLVGKQGNLFLVGDEDQSIYGFRAAYPEALMEFEGRYPGAQVLLMEKNYRSTRQIVEAADGWIRRNLHRHPKRMEAQQGDGPAIAERWVASRQDQYGEILRLAWESEEDTAVLYRENDSVLPLIDLLDREGVAYRCRQLEGSFFSNRTVRDVTDIIQFARNDTDGEIFLRIYYKLGARINKAVAEEVAAASRIQGVSIWELLIQEPTLSTWIQGRCKALQTHCAHLLEESGDQAVFRIVHFMGYGEYLEERGMDASKLDLLEAIGTREPSPERLLDRLEGLRRLVANGTSSGSRGITLSTIHASKGLEYDRVILMDVVDGVFPRKIPDQTATQEELLAFEEERRLLYVAMTRAKQELSMFRFRRESQPSSFGDCLFPRERAPKKSGRNVREPSFSQQIQWASKDYQPGMRVTHVKFGAGLLCSRQGDIATILFDSGEEKRVSLQAAISKRLLQGTK